MNTPPLTLPSTDPLLVVLGIAQDAGYPQAGCRNDCCLPAWKDQHLRRSPCCVAAVDPEANQRWLFDCTPHFPEQLHQLDTIATATGIAGIFLTHAHIGHYTGLIHLGREAMGARNIPVYALPRMEAFLRNNSPWSLLVEQEHIVLRPLIADQFTELNSKLSVKPLVVPHRGECSETVAFVIRGLKRSVLYLPDIDSWEAWGAGVESVLETVDVAYLDGTFFSNDELPGRDLTNIPHPLISESIQRFAILPIRERNKIRFLHFNHTNPVLRSDNPAAQTIRDAGFHIAQQGEQVEMCTPRGTI